MIEIEVVTPPAGDIIPLADVKKHLRVDISDDDALIQAMTTAAAQHVGGVLAWRALQVTEYSATFDCWDGVGVYLPMPPVVVLGAVEIVDDSVVPPVVVALDLAHCVLDKELGRVRFYGSAVSGGGAAGRLRVRYTAGYAELPPWARAAILLLVGHLYENRETVTIGAGMTAIDVPFGVEALAAAHKAWRPGGAI